MKPDETFKTHLLTLDGVIHFCTAIACSIANPEKGHTARSLDIEHKVASSVNKQLSRYVIVEK